MEKGCTLNQRSGNLKVCTFDNFGEVRTASTVIMLTANLFSIPTRVLPNTCHVKFVVQRPAVRWVLASLSR